MKTILLVDDSELNIDLLSQILEDDYNFVVARDGLQGVRLAAEAKPDLVLMDISMPIMDGYEATQKIRERDKTLPIIGLSANAMQGDCEKAIAAGCSDYLTKPVNETVLLKKINKLLG